MGPIELKRGAPPVDRTPDRLVAAISIALSVAFLGAAAVALGLPDSARHGIWLSLHLALAGGAATAIAGVLPFFVAAFAAAPPADIRLRAASVSAIAGGAIGVTGGVVLVASWLAVAGGAVFVLGVVLIGAAAIRPVGRALGPARGFVTRSYLVALLAVGVGASIATLLLAGWPPIASGWGQLKPAHAWLNLVGFVSVVIATTLLHFFPTVVGARIPNHTSGRLAIGGIAGGAWLVALGYATTINAAVTVGAALALGGAAFLAWYELRVWRTRARWTSDLRWHAFAIGGLLSATAWFLVGIGIATFDALANGANPVGWDADRVIGPLVGGWVGMTILASATHLLPAVGPGDQRVHARQREVLGRFAIPRLLALDAGVALLAAGQLMPDPSIAQLGVILLAAGYAATAILIGLALTAGVRWAQAAGPSRPR